MWERWNKHLLCRVIIPQCSNYVALMFDDIGPLIPNQLSPVGREPKGKKNQLTGPFCWSTVTSVRPDLVTWEFQIRVARFFIFLIFTISVFHLIQNWPTLKWVRMSTGCRNCVIVEFWCKYTYNLVTITVIKIAYRVGVGKIALCVINHQKNHQQ